MGTGFALTGQSYVPPVARQHPLLCRLGAESEQDAGGDVVLAATFDHLDRAVQVDLAARQSLGDAKRVAGLEKDVEPPGLDPLCVARLSRMSCAHAGQC